MDDMDDMVSVEPVNGVVENIVSDPIVPSVDIVETSVDESVAEDMDDIVSDPIVASVDMVVSVIVLCVDMDDVNSVVSVDIEGIVSEDGDDINSVVSVEATVSVGPVSVVSVKSVIVGLVSVGRVVPIGIRISIPVDGS